MAFRTKKISQMDPKGAPLASTDLLEISELVSGSYVTKSITGAEIVAGATTGYVPYVGATQDLELGANELYTGKLWLYDAVNDNYGSVHFTDTDFHIEDADGHKMLVIEDGFMQIHKTDTIQSNLFTSGLTATRDHYLPNASGTIALTSDIPSLAGYVPTTRTLTINGTTQDLSADRTFTISTGITIGTTAITSGTVGRVLFEGTGNVVQESANLFWDNTNGRLGVGTSSPSEKLEIVSGAIQLSNAQGIRSRYTGGAAFTILQMFSDNNTYLDGANDILFRVAAGATTAMRLKSATGNVLINTTTDAGFKLDVNGTAIFRSNITLNSNALYIGTNSAMQLYTASSDIYIDNGNTSRKIIFNCTGSGQFQFNNGNVLVGTTSNIVSSKLTIESTTQGFLPPRMTTTQKNAIASPAEGLQVWDTTLKLMSVYNGTTWITL